MNTVEVNNNSIIAERLKERIRENRVSHAYLFEGPIGIDKMKFALDFVKNILCHENHKHDEKSSLSAEEILEQKECGNCSICAKIDHDNYEDLHYISLHDDKKSIGVDSIRDIYAILKNKPIGEKNILIIDDADKLTQAAQHTLLKNLEEPTGTSMIMLLAENRDNLIETILSRCVKFKLEDTSVHKIENKSREIVDMILTGKPIYIINKELSAYLKDKQKTLTLLDDMEKILMDKIKSRNEGIQLDKFEDLYNAIHEIENAREKLLGDIRINYVLKSLVLKITKS